MPITTIYASPVNGSCKIDNIATFKIQSANDLDC